LGSVLAVPRSWTKVGCEACFDYLESCYSVVVTTPLDFCFQLRQLQRRRLLLIATVAAVPTTTVVPRLLFAKLVELGELRLVATVIAVVATDQR